jgi:hypothetical protein
LVFGGWVLWTWRGNAWLDCPGRESLEADDDSGCGFDTETEDGEITNGYHVAYGLRAR